MEILEIQENDEGSWDKYISNSNVSTFYHQIGWRNVVQKTYGHKPIYLVAKENNEINGILPLFLMNSKIFGKKLVSLPFAPYGGVIADSNTIEKMLIEEAKKITKNLNANYVEFRQFEIKDLELVTNHTYVTSILKIDTNPEILWTQFRKNIRRYIKKSEAENLEIILNSKNIREFYDLYSQSMHSLGTPPHNHLFFKNLLNEFPEFINIVIVKHENNPIAAVFLLYFKDTMIYGWGASLKKYLNLSPNYLLFWEIIKYGAINGFNFFDFGRSQPNTGVYFFKEGWGAEPKTLFYQYFSEKQRIVDTSQSNPKRQIFAKVWRKIPLPIANILGPEIRGNLP